MDPHKGRKRKQEAERVKEVTQPEGLGEESPTAEDPTSNKCPGVAAEPAAQHKHQQEWSDQQIMEQLQALVGGGGLLPSFPQPEQAQLQQPGNNGSAASSDQGGMAASTAEAAMAMALASAAAASVAAGSSTEGGQEVSGADVVAPAGGILLPHDVEAALGALASVLDQTPTGLQILGQRYSSLLLEQGLPLYNYFCEHREAEALDQMQLEQGRHEATNWLVSVQVVSAIPGLDISGSSIALVELPASSTLAHLKRALSRSSGGAIPPHALVFSNPLTAEFLHGDDNQLSTFGLAGGAQVFLCIVDQDAELGSQQGVAEAIQHYTSEHAAQQHQQRSKKGKPGGKGKSRESHTPADRDEGYSGQVRVRFTIEEIEALVRGMQQYGTSWARIKNAYPEELGRRTQVNIKDKWRNLQKGMLTNWKDERSPLSEPIKQAIRDLSNELGSSGAPSCQQQQQQRFHHRHRAYQEGQHQEQQESQGQQEQGEGQQQYDTQAQLSMLTNFLSGGLQQPDRGANLEGDADTLQQQQQLMALMATIMANNDGAMTDLGSGERADRGS